MLGIMAHLLRRAETRFSSIVLGWTPRWLRCVGLDAHRLHCVGLDA